MKSQHVISAPIPTRTLDTVLYSPPYKESSTQPFSFFETSEGRLSKKKTSNHICISQPRLSSQVFMKWWKILSELWRISWRPEREDKKEDETQKATATFLATFILRFYILPFEEGDFFKKRGLYFSKREYCSEEQQNAVRNFVHETGTGLLTLLFMNL
jgi:hypothetical protein